MTGYDLPFVNSLLNGLSACLIVIGYWSIKTGRVKLHKGVMLSALAVSAIFLTSYLTYHFAVRGGSATRYVGEYRGVYLAVLLSHTVLAAAVAPLALTTAGLALAGRYTWHKRLGRITMPLWLYVSVTGVIVYLFLKDSYPKG